MVGGYHVLHLAFSENPANGRQTPKVAKNNRQIDGTDSRLCGKLEEVNQIIVILLRGTKVEVGENDEITDSGAVGCRLRWSGEQQSVNSRANDCGALFLAVSEFETRNVTESEISCGRSSG